MTKENNLKNNHQISAEEISEKILNEISAEEKIEKLEQLKKDSVDESVVFEVSKDKMNLYALFHEPLGAGHLMNFKSFCEKIKENYGLSSVMKITELKPLFDNRKFKQRILIGRGIPPVNGKNGQVVYHFDTNNVPKVKILDNGKADWFDRGIIHNVYKDQLLLNITEGEKGTPGKDVYGNDIPPLDGKTPDMPKSHNTYLSDDNLSMYAAINGRVVMKGNEIMVDDKLIISGVDNETGNIVFAGDIYIKGDVLSNFTIKADGDVVVDGAIEGATIISGGSVELKRGINGSGKGYIKCEKNFKSGFVENSEIIAGENINVDFSLNSTLLAGNKIVVDGRKGTLVGGEARARNSICVKNAGNDFFVRTILEVGVDVDILIKLDNMEKKVKKIREQNRAKSEAESVSFNSLRKNYSTNNTLSKELSEALEIIEELKNKVYIESDASITVYNMIYPKVLIRICGVYAENLSNNANTEYRLKDGEIHPFPCL